MRILVLLAVIGLVVAGLSPFDAAALKSKVAAKSSAGAKARKKAKSPQRAGKLQTDVSFDDSVLHGEYQSPEEALAKVENEKAFGDLIGVRKHFKDRLQKASEQE